MTTQTNTSAAPRYRVLSLTNIGRALVEEMIATNDDGEARRFLRASAFPAALVEGRRVTATNKRGGDYEDAFEAFARSGPAVLRARPVAALGVRPVEMPAREPTRAPDEPVNAREIARRAVANSPKMPESSIDAPAANRSNSSKSSPAVEAPVAPAAPLCARPGCGEPQAPWMDKCHPAMRVLCREDRARAMRVRVRKTLTAEEAVAYVFAAARLTADELVEALAVEASATAAAPARVEAEQPAPAPVEPLVACDGDCDGEGHGPAPGEAPPAVVAEGEPSAPIVEATATAATAPTAAPVADEEPVAEAPEATAATPQPVAPVLTHDEVASIVRRVFREEVARLFASIAGAA
jgi:hypothetical protein